MPQQHFGGGENAPPLTARQRRENELKANTQIICAVQPNADGKTLAIEVQKGAIGATEILGVGQLEIKAFDENKREAFEAGKYFAEGSVKNPKTGGPAGQVAVSGDNNDTDYSCLYKGVGKEGEKGPQDGQTLRQPLQTQALTGLAPRMK